MAKHPATKHSNPTKHTTKTKSHTTKKHVAKHSAHHAAAKKPEVLEAVKPLELTEHPEHYVAPELPGQSFSPQPVAERPEPAKLAPSKVAKLLETETTAAPLEHIQHEHEYQLERAHHDDEIVPPADIDPTARPDHTERSPEQQAALLEVQTRSAETNRYVYQRAKSLLVAAVLLSLASLYALLRSLTAEDLATVFLTVPVSLISLGMSAYLFYARDHNVVSLVLKIFLIVQLVNTLASLYSITDGKIDVVTINGLVLVFLVFVYGRVKSLRYY